jgi:methylated-DNA-[protein]-cysteine S-methyltransferase
MAGTPFQRRVWHALRRIPSGCTRSYGELARELGSSARAVGGACRRNPIPIVVPCHRVIAAGGGAGGFMGQRSGDALAIKTWLLDHERRES